MRKEQYYHNMSCKCCSRHVMTDNDSSSEFKNVVVLLTRMLPPLQFSHHNLHVTLPTMSGFIIPSPPNPPRGVLL